MFAINADIIEDRLYAYLMRDYEKDVRPTPHHTLPTNVTFGFLLQMVVDVDEKNQVLTSKSWLNINWIDYRLRWNVSEFGGIQTMHVPHYKVWKPDVILANNADPEYSEAIVSTDIYVTPRGNVSWLASAIFRSSCQMKVRYYPFDDQACNMTFASWSHNGFEISLLLLTEEGDISSYVNNSEFNLISMGAKRFVKEYSCCPGKPWPAVTITITLQRRPLFYVFNHILPCVLISSMALLGFYVPPDTGEKVTMCITTMLSMGVYLKTITEIIPPTSEAVPLIGVYYVVSLFMVCSATVVNVWTLNLHNRGFSNRAKNPSLWIRKWILNYMAKMLFITIHPPDSPALLQHTEEDDENNLEAHGKWRNVSTRKHSLGRIKSKLFKPESTSLRQLEKGQTQDHVGNSMAAVNFGDTAPVGVHEPREHSLSSYQKNYVSGKLTLMAHAHPPTKEQAEFFSALKSEFEDRFQKILKKVYRTLENNEIRQAVQEERNRIMWEWKQLAVIIDRLLLWLFIVATSLTTFLILFEPTLLRDRYGYVNKTSMTTVYNAHR